MEKAIERQRVLLEHLNPNSSNSVFSSSHTHQSTDLSATFCSAGQTGGFENDVVIVA
ncbi:3-ketoacyl-CoA thiolase peroxisomal-like, partial [Trifolium pratense]